MTSIILNRFSAFIEWGTFAGMTSIKPGESL